MKGFGSPKTFQIFQIFQETTEGMSMSTFGFSSDGMVTPVPMKAQLGGEGMDFGKGNLSRPFSFFQLIGISCCLLGICRYQGLFYVFLFARVHKKTMLDT